MTFDWLLALPNDYTGPYWLITGPSYGLTVSTFHKLIYTFQISSNSSSNNLP